jgi:hypothetical protein
MLVRGVALPAPIIGLAVQVTRAGVEITCIPALQRKMRKTCNNKEKNDTAK